MKCCKKCAYWNNDTGFCSIEMIPKTQNEFCLLFEESDDK